MYLSLHYDASPIWGWTGNINIFRYGLYQQQLMRIEISCKMLIGWLIWNCVFPMEFKGNVDAEHFSFSSGEWGNTSVICYSWSSRQILVTNLQIPYCVRKTTNWNVDLTWCIGIIVSRSLWYHPLNSDLIEPELCRERMVLTTASSDELGKVTNKGVEFSLSTVNVKTKDFVG